MRLSQLSFVLVNIGTSTRITTHMAYICSIQLLLSFIFFFSRFIISFIFFLLTLYIQLGIFCAVAAAADEFCMQTFFNGSNIIWTIFGGTHYATMMHLVRERFNFCSNERTLHTNWNGNRVSLKTWPFMLPIVVWHRKSNARRQQKQHCEYFFFFGRKKRCEVST